MTKFPPSLSFIINFVPFLKVMLSNFCKFNAPSVVSLFVISISQPKIIFAVTDSPTFIIEPSTPTLLLFVNVQSKMLISL